MEKIARHAYFILEIIHLVKTVPKYMPPFRPKIDETAFEDINNIMVKCWQEDPFDRPVFTALKLQIRKINRYNLIRIIL